MNPGIQNQNFRSYSFNGLLMSKAARMRRSKAEFGGPKSCRAKLKRVSKTGGDDFHPSQEEHPRMVNFGDPKKSHYIHIYIYIYVISTTWLTQTWSIMVPHPSSLQARPSPIGCMLYWHRAWGEVRLASKVATRGGLRTRGKLDVSS